MREDAKNIPMPDIKSEDYSTLVISLKKGDEVIIGDTVIRFCDYKKQWCRLMISAKKIVPIKRVHHYKTTSE